MRLEFRRLNTLPATTITVESPKMAKPQLSLEARRIRLIIVSLPILVASSCSYFTIFVARFALIAACSRLIQTTVSRRGAAHSSKNSEQRKQRNTTYRRRETRPAFSRRLRGVCRHANHASSGTRNGSTLPAQLNNFGDSSIIEYSLLCAPRASPCPSLCPRCLHAVSICFRVRPLPG